MFLKLALKSLLSRKGSVLLTLLSMSISVFVLLGVEHIRHQAKQSFASTVSGVDLIVGARTGGLNLLLYSVFHVGSPTNNISWQTYRDVADNPKVKWAVPMALGDSHKGYRVVGTTPAFFEHFSYSNAKALSFNQGQAFTRVFDVVLGAEVAKKLNYQLQDNIIIAHGLGDTSFKLHDENPFTIVGVLDPTGTPIDQTVHVSLQGIEAIHTAGQHKNLELSQSTMRPDDITSMMLGLNSKMATFRVQRFINNYPQEPLTSILPGVTLIELWHMMGMLENVLRLISVCVLIASLLGLSAMLLTSIRERHSEIQLLRMIGASPLYLFLLIELEAMLVSVTSIIIGAGGLIVSIWLSRDMIAGYLGLYINTSIFTSNSLLMLTTILILTALASMIPAMSGYRQAKFGYP